jgi:hypothetical protein
LAWARRMDLGPNPGENEEPGARLDRIPPSGCKKRSPGAKSGGRLEMRLQAGSEYKQWAELRYMHKFWGDIAIHIVHAFGFYLCL